MRDIIKNIPKIKHTHTDNFFLLAGPCVIESKDMAMRIAQTIVSISDKLSIPFVFKGSYKKANRSRIDSFTGIGDEKALEILARVGEEFDIPTVTDIHESCDAVIAAQYVDILQIPAFLVRQTDLVVAAARTGKFVNLKKGQFMAPSAMEFAAQKVLDCGNHNALITDRGVMFGYSDMVVDFTGIPQMQNFAPVIMDVTHSLQQPNQSCGVTGGRPAMIDTIARAAIAVGADGLFIETHPDTANAKSDGANMLPLDQLEGLMERLVALRSVVNTF